MLEVSFSAYDPERTMGAVANFICLSTIKYNTIGRGGSSEDPMPNDAFSLTRRSVNFRDRRGAIATSI
jgi:hypothetical protein